MKDKIKSKRTQELMSWYNGFYCLSTYSVELNGKVDEITIATDQYTCKSHFTKWTDEEFNLISKNVLSKFKRFVNNEKKIIK